MSFDHFHNDAMRARTFREAVVLAISAGNLILAERPEGDDKWLPDGTGVPDDAMRLYVSLSETWRDAEGIFPGNVQQRLWAIVDEPRPGTLGEASKECIRIYEESLAIAKGRLLSVADKLEAIARAYLSNLWRDRIRFRVAAAKNN